MNYKTQDNNQIIFKSKSCRAAEEFCKFLMERKAGFASIADGCLGGSLIGVLGTEKPSPRIHLLSRERGNCLQVRARSQKPRDSPSQIVLQSLTDGNLQNTMFDEIPSHHFQHVPDVDWDVHWCQLKLQRQSVALAFVLDQAIILPSTQGSFFALTRSF